jgi:hypothetical protein
MASSLQVLPGMPAGNTLPTGSLIFSLEVGLQFSKAKNLPADMLDAKTAVEPFHAATSLQCDVERDSGRSAGGPAATAALEKLQMLTRPLPGWPQMVSRCTPS